MLLSTIVMIILTTSGFNRHSYNYSFNHNDVDMTIVGVMFKVVARQL